MVIAVDEMLPNSDFVWFGPNGIEKVSLSRFLESKKVVIFGVPGAFTPTCHSAHVPSFIRTKSDFKKNGIDYLKSLDIFSEEKLRGEIFQTWQSLTIGNKKNRGKIYTWSEGDISLISSQFDETNLINNNAIFIANALSVDTVISYKVGDGEDVAGKARVASPLEPGIAFI